MASKEVLFDHYCHRCAYKNLDEHQEPCNECLEYEVNEDSHAPLYFMEMDPLQVSQTADGLQFMTADGKPFMVKKGLLE